MALGERFDGVVSAARAGEEDRVEWPERGLTRRGPNAAYFARNRAPNV